MKLVIGGKTVELEDAAVLKAIEDKAEQFEVTTDLVIRTKDEETAYLGNIKKEHETVGIEIAIKNAKQALGLNFEGKSMDKFAEAIKEKTLTEAKIEPEEKLKTALTDLKTLKATLAEKDNEILSVKTDFNHYKNNGLVSEALSSVLPTNTKVPKSDMLTILKNKFEFDVQDGNVVVKKGGEVIKTPTLDPMPVKDVMDKFFLDNPMYIEGAGGGAGGKDSTNPGSKMSLDKFIDEMNAKGVAPNSPEFMKELEMQQKAGTIEI